MTPENQESFSAIPGNLGSFMNTMQQSASRADEAPFDEYGQAESANPGEELPSDFGSDFGGEEKVVPKNVGRGLAHFTDRGIAFAFGLYAHERSEKYRATTEEMSELEEAFAVFLQDTGIDISPAVNLIIAIAAIYAFKANDVYHDRKENLAKEEQERKALKKNEEPEKEEE